MAKGPPTQDRFRIICEADADHMGTLLAQLTRMGLQNIGYELITDIKTFNKNGPRKVFETTADEFALEWVKQHPTFRVIDLVNHFQEHGRNRTSAYPIVRKLVESKMLRKMGGGNYQHASVKALAPPEKAKQRPEVKNWDVILKLIKNKSKFKVMTLTKAFVEQGRNPKSVSPILTNMIKQKLVKQISTGEYEVINSGIRKALTKTKTPSRAKAAKAKRSPNPSLNGSAKTEMTETTETAAHG